MIHNIFNNLKVNIFGILLFVVFVAGCSRNATVVSTQSVCDATVCSSTCTLGCEDDVIEDTITVLWQNVAGDVAASNVVSGQLPTAISGYGSVDLDDGIYYPPVISQLNSSTQYVFVLSVDNSDNEVNVYKYQFSSTTLSLDTDFGTNGVVSLTGDSSFFKTIKLH